MYGQSSKVVFGFFLAFRRQKRVIGSRSVIEILHIHENNAKRYNSRLWRSRVILFTRPTRPNTFYALPGRGDRYAKHERRKTFWDVPKNRKQFSTNKRWKHVCPRARNIPTGNYRFHKSKSNKLFALLQLVDRFFFFSCVCFFFTLPSDRIFSPRRQRRDNHVRSVLHSKR